MLLPAFSAYLYFGASSSAAATALRARMGATYASSPTNEVLLAALDLAVATLHRATGRIFRPVEATLAVDGTGATRLPLPLPVVSAEQLEDGGVTAITDQLSAGDTETVDLDDVWVREGAAVGAQDPRQDPVIEWRSPRGRWARGIGNVSVTATWGYVEPDGTTPVMILDCLARLCARALIPVDDVASQADLLWSRVTSETTDGRSYQLSPHAMSAGLTGDRQIDLVLRSYRRPAAVVVHQARRRAGALPWTAR